MKFVAKVDAWSGRQEEWHGRATSRGGRMADQSIDKREQYVAFTTHCLQLAKVTADRQSRLVPQRDGRGVAEAG